MLDFLDHISHVGTHSEKKVLSFSLRGAYTITMVASGANGFPYD